MGCHQSTFALANKPEIVKLTDYWNKKQPIPWVRIHRLPEYVHFPHMRHVNAGVTCQTCHGQIQEMYQVYQYASLNMGWCVNCHVNGYTAAQGDEAAGSARRLRPEGRHVAAERSDGHSGGGAAPLAPDAGRYRALKHRAAAHRRRAPGSLRLQHMPLLTHRASALLTRVVRAVLVQRFPIEAEAVRPPSAPPRSAGASSVESSCKILGAGTAATATVGCGRHTLRISFRIWLRRTTPSPACRPTSRVPVVSVRPGAAS